jgi:hypothetical protein
MGEYVRDDEGRGGYRANEFLRVFCSCIGIRKKRKKLGGADATAGGNEMAADDGRIDGRRLEIPLSSNDIGGARIV